MNLELARTQLSVITSTCDAELHQLQTVFDHGVTVSGRGEFEVLLCRLIATNAPPTPKTLDLIGHTTAGKLLSIGNWVIDASTVGVRSYFRELADLEVMARLGIHSVRLIGCLTAESALGRRTICTLSEILGIEVFGTRDLVHAKHFTDSGFAGDDLLACASDLRREVIEPRRPTLEGPRTLDLDALPTAPLLPTDRPWPVRIATTEQTRTLLGYIDRSHGTPLPGLHATPMCELALPSQRGDTYHWLEVLLDGELVRIYDGTGAGLVYRVDDPHALELLIENLPRL